MTLLAIALSVLGFAGLCLSMSRHQRDVLGRTLSPALTRTARMSGWTLLAVAYAIAFASEGAALGTVYWMGGLTLGAAVVAFTVTGISR